MARQPAGQNSPARRRPRGLTEERRAQARQIQVTAGYVIVGLSVLGGLLLSFRPELFGLRESNPAVGVGLTVLAGFRFLALRREIRRADQDGPA